VVPGGDGTGDVRDIGHDLRVDTLRDGADPLEVDGARVGRGTADDQLGLLFLGEFLQGVVVEGLVLAADTVGMELEELSGEVQRVAVRQMPPVTEIHTQHRVTRFEDGEVNGLVGLAARVGLHVGGLGTEQFLRTLTRETLHHVGVFTPAVVTTARVPLGILVGEDGPHRLQHRLADEVFRGDQFQTTGLALGLVLNGFRNIRVYRDQISVHHGTPRRADSARRKGSSGAEAGGRPGRYRN